MKRKVCVITGSRAEYGLLRPLMRAVKGDGNLQLQVIVTGMHLSPEFGLTYETIEEDGFRIDAKIEMLLSSDTSVGIAKSMGLALSGFSEAYERLKPDIIVVLGDRFEIFSAVAAAQVSRVPVAHLHGGEITEGVIDDAFRHSITKMSHLHFTSTETYQKRVVQLGEHPQRVFNTGALGLDNIKNVKLLSRKRLEQELELTFNKHNFLITFHPVTLEENTSLEQCNELLEALDGLRDTNLIFTAANADAGGRVINKMIDRYVNANAHKAKVFQSMGQLNYLSTMQFVDAVIGNSSSGIIEAPSFKIGTINIGDRQRGRIKAKSVIDCKPEVRAIQQAIKKLYSQRFQDNLKRVENPHGNGNAAGRIIRILKGYELKDILKKTFYDVKYRI